MRRWPALALILGMAIMSAAPAAPPTPAQRNAAVFDRVRSLVERHYWNDARLGPDWAAAGARLRAAALAAPDQRALYAVIGRLLDVIGDSHVFATDPTERAFEAERHRRHAPPPGAFGFSSWQQGGAWRVFAVDAGGPAARAGVLVGWRLAAVDGHAVDGEWHPHPGEGATLDFVDDAGAVRRIRLTAGTMRDDPAWRAARLADGTLVVTLDAFERGADRWLRRQIEAPPRPRAIVLDLRENGGGEAMAVARVAGVFFSAKRTLIEQVGRGRPLAVPVLGAGRRGGWDGPLAVLVGPRSASGAEALAALIADARRGETVGERTAGALTGAALYDLPDGGQLSVAEFDIRTGAGRRLEGMGFVPARIVHASDAALRRGEDPVLSVALRALAADRVAADRDGTRRGVGSDRDLTRSAPATQHEELTHGGSEPG